MPTQTRSEVRTDDLQLLMESLRQAIKSRRADTVRRASKSIELTLEERLAETDAAEATPLKRIQIQFLDLSVDWVLRDDSVRLDGHIAEALLNQAKGIAFDIGDAEQSMVLSMKWSRLRLLDRDASEADQAEIYATCSQTVGRYEQFHKTIDTPAYAQAITAMAVYLYRFGDRRVAKAKLRYAKQFLRSHKERCLHRRDVGRMYSMTGHGFRSGLSFLRALLMP
ncbi:MAG TPA: hypothetical protein VG964_03130 [Candidatus Saccharimonadales bacterium]|nr:hypothetical protein [Candidatus Saccharimonadales bacterium]